MAVDGIGRDRCEKEGIGWKDKVQGDVTAIGKHWGGCENLVLWKLPGICEGDPDEDS